jgi:general secretion pathway protein K
MREAGGAQVLEEDQADSGFALVAVLWFLLLVSVVVASFAVTARTDYLVSANARQKLRLDMLADGIATALSLQLTSRNRSGQLNEVRMDSSPLSCSAGRYTVGILIQDQAGLIDLNAASEALLATGLRSLGLSADEAVAAAIVSFRSYAPQAVVARADIPVLGGRKAGPFESVTELSDIQALSDFEPADLHRAFTVHSRHGQVDASLSPQPLAELLEGREGQTNGSQEATGASVLAIEVTLRDRATAIRGYSGFLTERSQSPHPSFKRVEPLFEPGFGQAESDPLDPCPRLLGDDIATLLAGVT